MAICMREPRSPAAATAARETPHHLGTDRDAATVIGDVSHPQRFPTADRVAAYNGMAAGTQIRDRHSDGCVYYDRKIKEGKIPREAPRALKGSVREPIYRQLLADARRASLRQPDTARGATRERL